MSDNKTPNATDRFDVVITSIFLNDAKPEDWAQTYEWKPSVGFTFKKINKSFEPQEPEMKARANGVANLWLWEAMGGKQAKNRFFDFMVETGVLNGKAWMAIKGVTAELFKDGTMRRIQGPPETTAAPATPSTQASPVAAAKSTPPPPAQSATPKTVTTSSGEPLPPVAAVFLDQALFVEKSDAFFRLKSALEVDGMLVCQAWNMAIDTMGQVIPTGNEPGFSQDLIDEIANRADQIESALREVQHFRKRQRFGVLLGMATTQKQIGALMDMAWAMLPKSHYDLLREVATMRKQYLKGLAEGQTPMLDSFPTPEVQTPKTAEVVEDGGGETKEEETTSASEEDIPF